MLQMTHGMRCYGMTRNIIDQISAKVVMSSHVIGFVGSLSSSEQQLWFPNQNVQDPDTWTFPHFLQFNQEYKKLVEDFNCDIQEFVILSPRRPSSSPVRHSSFALHSLHSTTTCNMELPQPGEPRKVQPPSQRTLSRQLMKSWTLWKTTIAAASNTRMLEQLALRTPMTIHATNEQDLNPRSCTSNDHPSVLAHEMIAGLRASSFALNLLCVSS